MSHASTEELRILRAVSKIQAEPHYPLALGGGFQFKVRKGKLRRADLAVLIKR